MLDVLIVGASIIIATRFIAKIILTWKKQDELEKKEDEKNPRNN